MKKLLTTVLAAALTLSLSAPAFAAEATLGQNGSQNIDVKAIYSDTTTTPDTYSVDVEWGEMLFTYTVDGEHVWDAEHHTYTLENSNPGWTSTGNTVKVTNHSNQAVAAAFAFAKDSSVTDAITGSFTYDKTASADSVSLAAGVVNQPTAADNVTATLSLSGALSANTTNAFAKIGTVTVTLS